ncbi:MAG: sodium:calcium antiporter [Chloroflexota bacterium]|nr:sodium:calcium antiporter [Chloroflexota bacterium]
MFQSMSMPVLIGIFLVSAAVIWVAGVQLSNTTDAIADHFHMGQALGGLLILAIATNLPEIAISVTAGLSGQVGLAIGNILGGIGVQTVVLIALDASTPDRRPLTRQVKSLLPVLEGSMVIAVLVLVILAKQLPPNLAIAGIGPGEAMIAATWIGGIFLLNKARKGLPWHVSAGQDSKDKEDGGEQGKGEGSGEDKEDKEGSGGSRGTGDKGDEGDDGHKSDKGDDGSKGNKDHATQIGRILAIFAVAAGATLVAGFSIEQAGDAIAQRLGMTGAIFGATFLAAATALPELSTGLQAIKLRDNQLAVSDIFGGNAFLPVLLLLVGVLSGRAVIPQAKPSDIYVASLGILLTTIYLAGLVFHSERRIWRVGIDSVAVLIAFVLGIIGLVVVPGG